MTSEKEMTFFDKLVKLQQDFVATKTEDNDFGGYKYRNIEKMLAALKPMLKEFGLFITFEDELVNLGERYYVKATVTILDKSGVSSRSSSAYAREEYERKKTDASQLTGAASTYARKYALAGLLGVDDGKNDPDSKDNDRKNYQRQSSSPARPASDKSLDWIRKTAQSALGLDNDDDISGFLGFPIKKIPQSKVRAAIDKIEASKNSMEAPEPLQVTGDMMEKMERGITLDDLPY